MNIRPNRRVLPAAVALTACLLAAGCSSSTNKNTSSSAPPAAPGSSSTQAGAGSSAPASTSDGSSQSAAAVSIKIKDFAFTVSGAVAAGAMVQVTNNDSEAHSVTADSGDAFDVTIQPGKTASLTAPKKAGSYKFHCMFHSNMHGTLTVTG